MSSRTDRSQPTLTRGGDYRLNSNDAQGAYVQELLVHDGGRDSTRRRYAYIGLSLHQIPTNFAATSFHFDSRIADHARRVEFARRSTHSATTRGVA